MPNTSRGTRRRVTLADVAAHAGASTTAVSYVVSGSPRPVSDALRARIEAALVDLDYRPDRTARALRTGAATAMLGLLVPHVTMPFFSRVADAVERVAGRHDHLVLFANTDFDPAKEAEAASRLIDAGVSGIIVLGEGDAAATEAVCVAARVPVVWVNNTRGLDSSGVHGGGVVSADHVHAGALATRHVLAAGATRPVFVGGFTDEETGGVRRDTVQRRYDGFRTALGAQDAAASRIPTDLTAADAYRAVTDHLQASGTGAPVADAFVVGTYGQAGAVLRALTDAGRDVPGGVPGGVSVVTFDGGPVTGHEFFPLTSVRQDLDAVASNALALIRGAGRADGPPAPVRFTLEQGATTVVPGGDR
ncbi:MAG: LacI family transcriptional regulator [Corynebacterium sp.]|nr:LacI family transcriptional regulator [Corynebacterium sp.]